MAENRHKIPVSGYNPRTKELFFSWLSDDGGQEPDRTLVFNLEYGHASYMDHGFTAMVNYQSDSQRSLRDFLVEALPVGADTSICDCDDSLDDIMQGDPYVVGRSNNMSEYPSLWNTQENTGSCNLSQYTDKWSCEDNGGTWDEVAASSTSLCTALGTSGFEHFCEDGTEGSIFVMASAQDKCLKQYETEYFERDFYNGSDDYTSSGYSSVLESGALHLDTDNEKMLQRVTVEYSGVSAEAVTAAMKFGKASQPDQLLSGLNYKLLSTTETLDDQSEASTADRISDRINPDDKAYFNLYTRGRYLGYQLRLTGDGPATITRITLSTRLAEK